MGILLIINLSYSLYEPVYVAPAITYHELSCSSYSSELLGFLRYLYEEKVCCDVILAAGSFQAAAHKIVLIAASGFLKSLLLDPALPANEYITLPSE